MTIRSITELVTQANATLPDNTTQLINPVDVRSLIVDFLDTMRPAYGAMSLTTETQALSPTPLVVAPFDTTVEATAGYYAVNLTQGTLTRTLSGVAGATDIIIASGGVEGGNNQNVTVEVYKNSVATGFKGSVTCSGTSDVVGFNIVGIAYSTTDAVYDLRASAPAGSYTFTNISFVAQAQPVNAF